MRKLLLMTTLLCLVVNLAMGQFNAGTKAISGSISYTMQSWDGEDGPSLLMISPTVGYFVIDNLAIILGPQYLKVTYPSRYDREAESMTGYTIGAKYFINYLYAGGSYSSTSWTNEDASNSMLIEAGYLYGLNEHVYIDLGVDYDKGLGDNKSVTTIFGLGISAFF